MVRYLIELGEKDDYLRSEQVSDYGRELSIEELPQGETLLCVEPRGRAASTRIEICHRPGTAIG